MALEIVIQTGLGLAAVTTLYCHAYDAPTTFDSTENVEVEPTVEQIKLAAGCVVIVAALIVKSNTSV